MFETLATGIDEVVNVEPAALSDGELHHGVVALRRERARLEAEEARLTDAWRARRIWADDGSKTASARLARECTLAETTARIELARARKLAGMPATVSALRAGKLSMDQAELLCRANQPAVAALFARDEAMLIDELISLDYRDSRRVVAYWRQAADDEAGTVPPCARDPRRHLHADRNFDASIDVRGRLDAVDGSEFLAELQRLNDLLFDTDWAAAKAEHGDLPPAELEALLGRSHSQRRADALCEMARRSAATPKDARAPRPVLTIHLGEASFARMCELAAGTVLHPGQLIPHLHRADIERVIHDGPSRHITDLGRRRRFTGALRRAIQVRDRTCQHPGCDTPAEACDIDHTQPWGLGGLTTQTNGRSLCPHHNRLRNQQRQRPPPDDG